MKKVLSKILPCLLIVLIAVGLVSCDKKYKHQTKNPMVSNKSEVFLSLGSKNLTNEQIYNRLVQTYGLDTVITWMDEKILESATIDEAEFEEQMNYIIYGTTDLSSLTDEKKAELKESFEKSMLSQGYETEEEWLAYYKLEYKRYSEGLKSFEQYVDQLNADSDESKHLFTDDDYQTAFETLYQPDYTIILLTFDSEFEARKILAENNVNINKLTFGWENNEGVSYDKEGIKTIFTNIYNAMNSDNEPEKTYKFQEKTYTNELSNVSTVISKKVSSLEALDKTESINKSYTHSPLLFGSRYYLVLKVSETEIETEYKNATEQQVKEVKKYLIESTVSSDYLLYAAQLNHVASNVKIFDEALEIGYEKYYNENVSEVGIELEKNQKFSKSDDESDTVVAEITVNGTKHQLTADELFDRLLKQYGSALSLLYIQEYTVLSNTEFNTVTNYLTGEVLDKETYDKYYETDVKTYKDALENGDYEDDGFPANYGWDYFMVDYLGVSSEWDLMHTYGSSIYNDAEANYIKSIYLGEEKSETNEEGETTITQTKDQAVQDEMQRIFDNFFSSAMIGAYAYYDANNDGIADEMTSEQEARAKELINLVYEEAKAKKASKTNNTLENALEDVINEYKATAFFEVNKYQSFKKEGIKLVLVSSTTYIESSSVADEIKNEAKEQWTLVKNYKETSSTTVDPLGQTLDPGYRYQSGSDVYYVTSEVFGDQREAFVANNAVYKLIITKAKSNTYIKKSDGLFKPTLAEYESYQNDSSNVSSSVATAIKTYYTTAIANLTTTEIVSDKLFNDAKSLINNETVKFVSKPAMKDTVLNLINNSLSSEE